MNLIARLRENHRRTTLRDLGIGDVGVECCCVCMDEPWPCDAIRLADILTFIGALAATADHNEAAS